MSSAPSREHRSQLTRTQLIGPITPGSFIQEDFAALESYEYGKRIKPVYDLLKTMYADLSVFDMYVRLNSPAFGADREA